MIRFANWPVAGEGIPRLAIRVHGDSEARKVQDDLVQMLVAIRNEPLLTIPQLDERIRGDAAALGLIGVATEARCISDPLATVVDLSFYRAPGNDPIV